VSHFSTGLRPVELPLMHLGATPASCPSACCFLTDVRRRLHPHSRSTSPKLLAPTACSSLWALPMHPLRGVWKTYLASQKCRPQGLATLSTVSAPKTLGSLFQPPTLLGFPLQSFLSSSMVEFSVSQKLFPSCTSQENLFGLRGVLQGLHPTGEAGSPFCFPED